jgi:hypothetical protein
MTANNESKDRITYELLKRWWEDVADLRCNFFKQFVFGKRKELIGKGKGLKGLRDSLAQINDPDVIKLCYYFDFVGFLAAAKKVDINVLLPPMYQSMRKTWLAVKEFIMEDRRPKDIYFDPIYMAGFEWLFNESEKYKKDPSKLYISIYGEAYVLSSQKKEELNQNLTRVERQFLAKLEKQRQ